MSIGKSRAYPLGLSGARARAFRYICRSKSVIRSGFDAKSKKAQDPEGNPINLEKKVRDAPARLSCRD